MEIVRMMHCSVSVLSGRVSDFQHRNRVGQCVSPHCPSRQTHQICSTTPPRFVYVCTYGQVDIMHGYHLPPRPTSAWHPCKGSWKWQWCQESYYRYSTRMTGFSALAIKSTLIPPITTFKREENGKKWLEDLRRHFPSLLCFS